MRRISSSRGHVDEVAAVTGRHGGLENAIEGGMLCFDEVKPRYVYVLEGPGVLEFCAGCLRADGSGVVGIAVEGRVQVDEVNGFRIHAPHDGQIVLGEDCLVAPVLRSSHLARHHGSTVCAHQTIWPITLSVSPTVRRS